LNSKKSVLSSLIQAYKAHGLRHLVRTTVQTAINLPKDYSCLLLYRAFKKDTFELKGNKYLYFYQLYGTTWRNERSVEIPFIWDVITRSEAKTILEVGNVLSYRFPVRHEVLDKYDKSHGIIREDVAQFNPGKKYDLIVSISTLEHVGWDESPKEPIKILQAFENLKSLLAPGGQLFVTLPLGYNHQLDEFLKNGLIKFDEQYCMKRSKNNRWHEVSWDDIKDLSYDKSIPSANGLIIGKVLKAVSE
jgi:hypothetical protein